MFACVINLGTHQFRWPQNASKQNIAPNLQRYSESSNPCECPKTWDCDPRHASCIPKSNSNNHSRFSNDFDWPKHTWKPHRSWCRYWEQATKYHSCHEGPTEVS